MNEALNSVYFGSSFLCSVDMDSGVNNWITSGGGGLGEGGIAVDSQENIYYGTNNGGDTTNFLRSSSSTGTFRWEQAVGIRGSKIVGITSSDTILIHQRVGVGEAESLIALDNTGTTQEWEVSNVARPVIDEANNIYVSSTTGPDVTFLNPDGSQSRKITLPNESVARVDFVDNQAHVYVRGAKTLYALNTSDGSVAWSFVADADLAVAAVLAPAGDIFLSDTNKTLYLLDTCLGYANSAWPIAEFGNRRHSEKVNDSLPLPTECGAGPQPVLSVTPSLLDFGTAAVGSSKDLEFTVMNTGEGTLTGTASTSAPFAIVSGGSYSLSAGTSQTVVVRFAPTAPGSFTGNVSFASNGGDTSQGVTGIGDAAPVISVSPSSLDFASVAVGSSADRTFTVQNAGGETLTGTCNTAAPFSLPNGCSFSLTSGQSADVTVRFSPTATGPVTGTVDFTSIGGDVSLTATGEGAKKPLLTINKISPTSGPAGTVVTIKGKNFGATQGSSFVSFGAVKAAINSWADGQIQAVAPAGPSGTVLITVTTAEGTSDTKDFTYTTAVSTIPFQWPLHDVGAGNLSQDYAQFNGIGTHLYHTGLDIGAALNTTVKASADGNIVMIQENDVGCTPPQIKREIAKITVTAIP